MKKILTLVLGMMVLACATAFASEASSVPLDASATQYEASALDIQHQDGMEILRQANDITIYANDVTKKILKVEYAKIGDSLGKVVVGDHWNFHKPTGLCILTLNSDGVTHHTYDEADGTQTIYATVDSIVKSITRVSSSAKAK